MPEPLINATEPSAGAHRVRLEFDNRLPFAVKIIRKAANGRNYCANILPAYRRYVQEAAEGERISVKLAANGWPVTTVRAGARARCPLTVDKLRARVGRRSSDVAVRLDLPLRNCILHKVDNKGKQRKLKTQLDARKRAPVIKLPVGSLIRGSDPTGKADYFWLIVTKAGQANLLGQTFSTGVGWGVEPEPGEAVLFLDLGLGSPGRRKKGALLPGQLTARMTKPGAYDKTGGTTRPGSSSCPFWVLCHQDVPDISAILDSRMLNFPDVIHGAPRSKKPRAQPAQAASMYEVLTDHQAGQPGKLKSAGVKLVGVRTGSATRAVGYAGANYKGAQTELTADMATKSVALRSLNLERVATAERSGLRVLTSLSEDYEIGRSKKLETVSTFRTTLIVDDPAVDKVTISAWEPTRITVDGKAHTVGPTASATFQPNEMRRVLISMAADTTGAPELLVQTNTMVPGASLVVYPDQEMHEKIAHMPEGALFGAKLAGTKLSREDCQQVETALRNVSGAVVHRLNEATGGVASARDYDASHMQDKHWSLELDSKTGRPSYRALTRAQAQRTDKAASAGIRDIDRQVAQGLFKDIKKGANKATKVVVKTGSSVANTVGTGLEDAGKDVADTLTDAAKDTGDFIVDAANSVADAVEMTVHYLDKTAVRFIVRTAKQAAAAIESLIEVIGAAVSDFIDWVRFLFDWRDIKRCQRVYARAINSKLKQGKRDILRVKNSADQQLARLQSQLKAKKAKPRTAESASGSATSPTQSSGHEKAEWLLSKLQSGSKKRGAERPGSPDRSDSSLASIMRDATKQVSSLMAGFDDFAQAVASGQMQALGAIIQNLAIDFGLLAIDLIRGLINALASLVTTLLDGVKKALNARIKIPLVTEIYETFIGGTFNIVNITALLLALPVTVTCKLATGKAPYTGKESLAQASTLEVTAGLGMGILDIISGFASAYSTAMAGSDPVSPKTRDTMWTLGVIFKTCSLVESVFQPILVKDDGAELLVTLFSALRSFGQLVMQFLSDNTRHAEVLLEAFYGLIKWVAGGLEIGFGHKSGGTALVLEGTGALCQLGGYAVGNPVVYGGAAVVSALFYQAGATVRIATI